VRRVDRGIRDHMPLQNLRKHGQERLPPAAVPRLRCAVGEMISIAALTEADVGRWVAYKPACGDSEKGRIKSFNDKFVFVVYKCDFQWDRFQDFTGCATDPEDLEFINKGEII